MNENEITLVGEKTPETSLAATTPAQILSLAVNKGAAMDMIERFMAAQEKWEANEARKAYTLAMSQFRADCPAITKTHSVSFGQNKTSYRHAGLSESIEQIKSLLAKCGLSHSWRTTQNNGTITVECVVTHVQGHSESTSLSAAPDTSGSKNSIQAIGSTVTYLQRYTLFAILGLASQDQDNDGKGDPNLDTQKLLDEDDPEVKKQFAAACHLKYGKRPTPEQLREWLTQSQQLSGKKTIAECTAWLKDNAKIMDEKVTTNARAA